MSDDEIALWLRHSSGKACGRFSSEQLNRAIPMIDDPKPVSSWWKIAALIPLAFFVKKAQAQDHSNGTSTVQTSSQKSTVANRVFSGHVVLKGTSSPLQGAKILVNGTQYATTDANGNFQFDISASITIHSIRASLKPTYEDDVLDKKRISDPSKLFFELGRAPIKYSDRKKKKKEYPIMGDYAFTIHIGAAAKSKGWNLFRRSSK